MNKKISMILALLMTLPLTVGAIDTKVEKLEKRAETSKAVQEKKIEKVQKIAEKKVEKATTTVEKAERKIEKIKEETNKKIEKLETKVEKVKEARKQVDNKKVINYVTGSIKKLTAAISRVEILAKRVSDRLNILSSKGVIGADTKTKVETKLNDAVKTLVEAKTLSAQIIAEAKNATSSESIAVSIKNIKDLFGPATEKIKSAHAQVVEATSMIKASGEKAKTSEKKANQ